MNILLDTHILLWALGEDPRLSEKAKGIILDPGNVLYYSAVSVWEIAIKHSLHPDNVRLSGQEMSEYCRQAGYLPLDLRDKHIFALEEIRRAEDAPRHNDPFDRILLSQAKTENMSFLTHDRLFSGYGESCVLLV